MMQCDTWANISFLLGMSPIQERARALQMYSVGSISHRTHPNKKEWDVIPLAHDSTTGDLRDMGEVEYRTERPLLEGSAVRRKCYLAKSKCWEYEHEHRLVRSSSDRELDASSLAPLLGSLMLSVTLGANVSDETHGKVVRILNGNPALALVKVYQGELHVEVYTVTRSLLNP
jgi:hypothetical protein